MIDVHENLHALMPDGPQRRLHKGLSSDRSTSGFDPARGPGCGLFRAGDYTAGLELSLLREPLVLRHRGFDQRLECLPIDLFALFDVDGPAQVAFESGIEQASGIREARAARERELHRM